jgi:hypothetical protein
MMDWKASGRTGYGRGVIEALSRHLPGATEKYYAKQQTG